MKAVPTVTLHRASLSNCAKIIRDNLAEQGYDTTGLGSLAPYPNSVAAFFQALEKILEADLASINQTLGSPGLYIRSINNALKPVRTLMPGDGSSPVAPIPATGATEVPGAEGTFTPAGADLPVNLAAMAGIAASPTTGWVEGSFMTLGDASICHWDDAAWIVGAVPVPAPIPATGATEVAGLEGSFTPAGAVIPANLAELVATPVVADPATLWSPDSFVTTADAALAHWDSTAWVIGVSPPAPIPATGATEVVGLEGTYTPAGAVVPANLAELSATPVVASPTAPWTTASFVTTEDALLAHWNGTVWVVGAAPVIAAGELIDMDGDGKPDDQVAGAQGDGKVSVTVDEDSINIDITGDDKAEIVIPK